VFFVLEKKVSRQGAKKTQSKFKGLLCLFFAPLRELFF
jgi:hypothetical protein